MDLIIITTAIIKDSFLRTLLINLKMIYQTVALALIAGAAAERLYTEDAKTQKYMWEGFKREYGRDYGTMDEETRRFTHFVQNLRIADDRNTSAWKVRNPSGARRGSSALLMAKTCATSQVTLPMLRCSGSKYHTITTKPFAIEI